MVSDVLGRCQHCERWCLKATPEAHRIDTGDACHVQGHYRAVRYYDGGFGSVGCDYPVDGCGESMKRLMCHLFAQHKLHQDCGRIARLPVQSLPAWESRVRCSCGALRVRQSPAKGRSARRRVSGRSRSPFGSLLHQIEAGVKPRSSSANSICLIAPTFAESPSGRGLVGLYFRFGVADQYQVIHCLSGNPNAGHSRS